ncbi:transcriptional repressor general negative regulator of transcription subunit 4 [Blastocladiella emersonii ATCC 22665]|nr:transcriptional repressor general negative regulator of transcription subunit 4 [Blastocladiella emersonii ATCC 22665]
MAAEEEGAEKQQQQQQQSVSDRASGTASPSGSGIVTPPVQGGRRVLVIRSQSSKEKSLAEQAAEAKAETEVAEPAPTGSPKVGRGQAAKAKTKAPVQRGVVKSESSPSPSPSPSPVPAAMIAKKQPEVKPEPVPAEAARAPAADALAVPAGPSQPELPEEQVLVLRGTEVPITLLDEAVTVVPATQATKHPPATPTVVLSKASIEVGRSATAALPVALGAVLQSTGKLLADLGMGGELLIKDIDQWHRDMAAAEGAGATAARATLDELADKVASFFDRGTAILFGVPAATRPAPAKPPAPAPAPRRTGPSKHARALAAVIEALGGTSEDYATEDDIVKLEEELLVAKNEARIGDLRFKAALKKSRKAGLA